MSHEIVISAVILFGTFFTLVGSIGLLRMPDFYTRVHTVTKAATLGLASLLFAAFLTIPTLSMGIKALLAITFHFLTNPVGAHMITRAAYFHLKVPFWKNTIISKWHESEYHQ